MMRISDLINKSMVSIDSNQETAFSMEVTAEWENILKSLMVLRDDDGHPIRLRRDEMIRGIDYD